MEERRRGSFGFAVAWMMALSIPLCVVPLVGPFLAGAIGGRRARDPWMVVGAAILPALFIGGILTAQSHQGLKVGGNLIFLPPMFAGVQVLALVAGALTGAVGRASKAAGFVLMVASIYLFQTVAGPLWNARKLIQPPAVAPPAEANKTCPDRLKKLYDAVMLYAPSWDDTLPPADRWMTALNDPTQRFAEESVLHCPAVSSDSGPKYGYAMNAALGGKKLKEIKAPASTPLFYDSSNLSLNAHDDVTSLPVPGRHDGHNNVVYLDGHIAQR